MPFEAPAEDPCPFRVSILITLARGPYDGPVSPDKGSRHNMKTRLLMLVMAGMAVAGLGKAADAQSVPYRQQPPQTGQYPRWPQSPPYWPPYGNPGTFPGYPRPGGW